MAAKKATLLMALNILLTVVKIINFPRAIGCNRIAPGELTTTKNHLTMSNASNHERFLKPDYECFVMQIKRIQNKTRNSYKLISQKFFPSISIYGGLYEGSNCSAVGMIVKNHNRKYVPITNSKAEKFIGISDLWHNTFTFVIIQPKKKQRIEKKYNFGSISVSNSPKSYFVEFNECPISRHLLDELIEKIGVAPFKSDTSMARAHIWGPLSNMLKGYAQVKSGKVLADDYYWEDNYNDGGHWTRCDVSFSAIKPGNKVTRHCMVTVTKEKRTPFYYHNEFVIRKINK